MVSLQVSLKGGKHIVNVVPVEDKLDDDDAEGSLF